MIQGTSSDAGKSLICAALCRLFTKDGYSCAPFKSQNMALNSYVTPDGLEIGRAQALQARAAMKEADVRMNPVLLKPCSDNGSQLIVNGKARGMMKAREYGKYKEELKSDVLNAYNSLAKENDIIVIEGAGSPAEINLKKGDISNMFIAKECQAPVFIVGDIDRGGVYAHFLGTYEMLDEDEKQLVKGFIINKFRGDSSLLAPANEYIEERCGVKVYGPVPFLEKLNLPQEDSVSFKRTALFAKPSTSASMNIAIVNLPRISNFTDFDPFATDDGVHTFACSNTEYLNEANIIIIPGTKDSIADLRYIKGKGIAQAVIEAAKAGKLIVGVCGGYQMLGETLTDEFANDGSGGCEKGLGLLKHRTQMLPQKTLKRTRAKVDGTDIEVDGYEIHHGESNSTDETFMSDGKGRIVGTLNGNVIGSYLHGLFDSASFRNYIYSKALGKATFTATHAKKDYCVDAQLDELAQTLREFVDIESICKSIGAL